MPDLGWRAARSAALPVTRPGFRPAFPLVAVIAPDAHPSHGTHDTPFMSHYPW